MDEGGIRQVARSFPRFIRSLPSLRRPSADRFGHRGTVDHLAGRNQIRRRRAAVPKASRQVRVTSSRTASHTSAGPSRAETCPVLKRRVRRSSESARHVRHPFQAHRTLRAKHLEAEAGPGRGDDPRYPDAPFFIRKSIEVVSSLSTGPPGEALAVHVVDLPPRSIIPSMAWTPIGQTPARVSSFCARQASGFSTSAFGTSSSLRSGGACRARPSGSAGAASSSRDGSGGCSRARA